MNTQKILYINGGILNRGGIESFMMNYYLHFDCSKLQIDFVVHGNTEGYYDNIIKERGSKIYYIPVKSQDYKGNIRALNEIFSTKNYKIVHSHMDAMSYIPLRLAKNANIPYRIAHSHNTNHLTNNPAKILLNEYARFAVRNTATHFFACSEAAGKWLFGDTIFKKRGKIIYNAIDIEKFLFNADLRNKIRKELNIDGKFVIGHVGRFDYQKNHSFLIDIFANVNKINKNTVLVLIGEGFLKKDIENKVNNLSLSNNVIFLGSRPDVNRLLNAFDVFLFPSKYEGLGLCLIEAQANSLPSLVANTITHEVFINNLLFKPIINPQIWVKDTLNAKRENNPNIYNEITENGYNIEIEAKQLQNFYLDLLS